MKFFVDTAEVEAIADDTRRLVYGIGQLVQVHFRNNVEGWHSVELRDGHGRGYIVMRREQFSIPRMAA